MIGGSEHADADLLSRREGEKQIRSRRGHLGVDEDDGEWTQPRERVGRLLIAAGKYCLTSGQFDEHAD